jgi:hypothetical protein
VSSDCLQLTLPQSHLDTSYQTITIMSLLKLDQVVLIPDNSDGDSGDHHDEGNDPNGPAKHHWGSSTIPTSTLQCQCQRPQPTGTQTQTPAGGPSPTASRGMNTSAGATSTASSLSISFVRTSFNGGYFAGGELYCSSSWVRIPTDVDSSAYFHHWPVPNPGAYYHRWPVSNPGANSAPNPEK